MNEVLLFTDGCCLGNPGPGGWACLVKEKDREFLLKGGSPDTTNNRMELLAVIKGLGFIPQEKKVVIFTDSEYVLKGATEWMKNWKKRGFKTSSGKPVKNRDLWEKLDSLLREREVKWVKVRAHSGHKENEFVDFVAKAEAEKWKLEE